MPKHGLAKWLWFGLAGAAACAVARWLLTPAETPGQEIAYRGNEDSRVFHAPDCRFFGSGSSSRTFRNRSEAIDAGFTPCSVCSP